MKKNGKGKLLAAGILDIVAAAVCILGIVIEILLVMSGVLFQFKDIGLGGIAYVFVVILLLVFLVASWVGLILGFVFSLLGGIAMLKQERSKKYSRGFFNSSFIVRLIAVLIALIPALFNNTSLTMYILTIAVSAIAGVLLISTILEFAFSRSVPKKEKKKGVRGTQSAAASKTAGIELTAAEDTNSEN